MALSSDQCTPYLSVSLYKAVNDHAPAPAEIVNAIRDLLIDNADSKDVARPRFPVVSDPSFNSEGTSIAWAHYVEKRAPSWFVGEGITDTLNQLIVVAKRGNLYALLFSDNGLRAATARKILRAEALPLAGIRRLSSTEINRSFVESQVRTLWFSGTHRRTSIKPDSKILSGLELETSLDPLGDQSYYFSSVRSTISLADQVASSVVGASPIGGRIWIGPTRSWQEFMTNIRFVLDRAAQHMSDATRSDRPLPVLASAINSLAGIQQPYDVALIVPEQTTDDEGGDHDGEPRWLQQFGDMARFEVAPEEGTANFQADVYWAQQWLGKLSFTFEQTVGSDIRLKTNCVDGFDVEERDADILKICRRPENVTVYFDTGHTFSRGHFYETRFRDARFSEWRWVSMSSDNTAFSQENAFDRATLRGGKYW